MGNANTHPTNLTFIMVNRKRLAQQMLDNAEQIDFYLDTCRTDPINAKARKYYSYAANSITPSEYTHYQQELTQLIPSIPQRLRMDLETVHIIPLMLTADGGMPHTRPHSLICVSRLPQLTSLTTMVHELWHIHQRKYKELWKKVFAELGWTEWKGELPGFLEKNRRSNPDTIDAPLWIYQDTWIPIPVFRDISIPDLTDVDVWFYHVHDKYHLKQVPNVLKDMFPNVPHSSYEHPRELTAYILSEHEKHIDSPALTILFSKMGRLAIMS
jgi:hypothetical protein